HQPVLSRPVEPHLVRLVSSLSLAGADRARRAGRVPDLAALPAASGGAPRAGRLRPPGAAREHLKTCRRMSKMLRRKADGASVGLCYSGSGLVLCGGLA